MANNSACVKFSVSRKMKMMNDICIACNRKSLAKVLFNWVHGDLMDKPQCWTDHPLTWRLSIIKIIIVIIIITFILFRLFIDRKPSSVPGQLTKEVVSLSVTFQKKNWLLFLITKQSTFTHLTVVCGAEFEADIGLLLTSRKAWTSGSTLLWFISVPSKCIT